MADISHQIRTVWTSHNILTSLLSKPDLTDTRRNELFNELDILLSRIEWLITTLLKISKLDTGTIKLKKEKIMVCDLIKKAIEPIAISLELREQEIHTKILGDETLYGDFGWTVEAVENILKIAWRNTKGSIIRITALENVLYTEITITDNGPGIQRRTCLICSRDSIRVKIPGSRLWDRPCPCQDNSKSKWHHKSRNAPEGGQDSQYDFINNLQKPAHCYAMLIRRHLLPSNARHGLRSECN